MSKRTWKEIPEHNLEARMALDTLKFNESARGPAGESSLLQLYKVCSWLQFVAEGNTEIDKREND